MFINRILKTVSFSQPALESHRAMLFQLIKECDDFPYGLQAEPMRRVHTRNGDIVGTKLAQDIYFLMSVLEGSDYSDLKDLIAGGRKGHRTQSQSQSTDLPSLFFFFFFFFFFNITRTTHIFYFGFTKRWVKMTTAAAMSQPQRDVCCYIYALSEVNTKQKCN